LLGGILARAFEAVLAAGATVGGYIASNEMPLTVN
jgi:hypothetical protein